MTSLRPAHTPLFFAPRHSPSPLLCVMLVMLAFLAPARQALADNSQHSFPCNGGSATLIMPNITVTDVATGSFIGNPVQATATFTCPNSGSGNPWQYYRIGSSSGIIQKLSILWWPYRTTYPNISIQGVFSGAPTYSSSLGGVLYPTSLSGVSLLLTASPDQITSATGTPTLVTIDQGTTTTQVIFTAQLVRTGPVDTGTVSSMTLMHFQNYSPGYTVSSAPTYGALTVNTFTISMNTCRVTVNGGGTVVLPTVWQSALASPGKVAGATRFSIMASGCNSSLNTVRTYFSSNTVDKTTGNLANTSSAGNVEVQLLDDQNGSAPINLNDSDMSKQTAAVNLSDGSATLNYQAQYYATGAATAGSVKSTVQFTMVYQ